MASVKLFGAPTSTEVARVLACLFEKEIDFQLIRIDTFKGIQRQPDFLKLQPTGQALTFEHGDKTLVDSREIIRYVAKKFPNKKNLAGRGMLEMASIEQWLQTDERSFDPPSSFLVFHLAFAPALGLMPAEEKEISKKEEDLKRVLDIYEQQLRETDYLAGDEFSLADLSHLPNAHYLMGTRCASLFNSRKKVKKWWDKISGRDAWKKVLAMQQDPSTAANLPPAAATAAGGD
ncbi:hypothetical protein Taro_032062 [Colocasia esculenta]|uniref:glutathione transferase n=1 Tax=Colocasia esculenta TaxID=4460 RepID=A0A843VRN8_COLES|nr:hypothetical protein [Colocasia esculenta]